MRLLLVGYFGAGNLGDELILKTAADFLMERFPGAKLLYLSRGQADPPRRGLRPLHFLDLGRIAYWAAKASAALFPGGSVLQNKTSLRSLFYYRTVAGLLRRFGTPYFMLGQGIGPLLGRVAQGYAREVLRGAEWISARDQPAFIEMARLLGPSRRLHLGADTTLLTLTPSGSSGPAAGGRLVLIPRSWLAGEGLYSSLSRLARELRRELVVLPFQPGERELAGKLANQLSPLFGQVAVTLPSLDDPLAPLRGAGLVISCRYHGVLLAALAGSPALPLGDDPKLAALAESLALPVAAGPEELPRLVGELFNARESRLRRQRAALSRLRDRCRQAWQELADRLGELAG